MPNTYTLFWLTGSSEVVKGDTIAQAMTLAGYGGGSVRALDFYLLGNKINEYEWDASKRYWGNKEAFMAKDKV